jgi:stage III sporulation protein SpoIIIAA|tara:strand:- start:12985 stop:14640 length:1656 start_codon:yes stop_codon:yes gene_type:complete
MLITDDLEQLLKILPGFIKSRLIKHPKLDTLIEIVMDLGRRPEARFPSGPEYLSDSVISWQDLEYSIKYLGNFTDDNRAGIERTLHRISCIKNRFGNTVGLTCRVGRAIFGTISVIRDLLETHESLLLLGRPGVGKTTAIREVARILSMEMEKRVVIIDTSNEIAGDGDIPHPAIGRARRMQVSKSELQHQVMIESIENHMPEVIIIDEIGTELEALAAQTIAERGVQLVGTAHGNSLESLIKNPVLSSLIGSVQPVILGDQEALKRGTQKSILERSSPTCFNKTIEIQEQHIWVIHENTEKSVDQILQGFNPSIQKRDFTRKGFVLLSNNTSGNFIPSVTKLITSRSGLIKKSLDITQFPDINSIEFKSLFNVSSDLSRVLENRSHSDALKLYVSGINVDQTTLIIKKLNLPIIIQEQVQNADVILAFRTSVSQNKKLRHFAKLNRIEIHTIQNNTIHQITRVLRHMLKLSISKKILSKTYPNSTVKELEALDEVRLAIERFVIPRSLAVELSPRSAFIRKLQHELVEYYQLNARSFGEEPFRRVRIFPN